MDAPKAPVLECREVTAGYPGADGRVRPVLSNVSFVLAEAGRLVLLGRSGSGKSTLLRLLNRLDEPISGTVLYRGQPVTAMDPTILRRRVALVLQKPVVFDRTVRDNLEQCPKGAVRPSLERMGSLLEEVGLGGFLDRSADALSVGEQQRVCLARALVQEPEVLLLDEPTSALDPRSVGVIAELVLDLASRRRLGIVVATHQPELVRRLSGDVLLLEGGVARPDATSEQIAAFLGGG